MDFAQKIIETIVEGFKIVLGSIRKRLFLSLFEEVQNIVIILIGFYGLSHTLLSGHRCFSELVVCVLFGRSWTTPNPP